MPPNQRCVKNKWVFPIKRNGVYQACLIACGYHQVLGIDFSENHSTVVNDITFYVQLLMVLHFSYLAKIVEIETTFLYGDLEEEIFMDCPQGMSNIKKDDCVILNKCIYSLVQAVRHYYKKAVGILKSLGFVKGSIDPCHYGKKSTKGIVHIALYVDHNLMILDITRNNDATEALKNKGLMLKIVEGLQDYLSCKNKFSNHKKCSWLGQPHLIKNLESKFEGLVQEIQSHKTHGSLKFSIVRPMEEIENISAKDQKDYCSDVGVLLYLVKHSCPDLANMTRELSNANDSANPAAYKELLCVIKNVIETKILGLKIEPMGNSNEPWDIICISNSDYAGDPASRQSISGFVLYVLGVLVSWQSKSQKSVSFSSSEAEYTALSDVVKQVMFMVQLFESMNIIVKYQVMVRVDNVGAIFMASNIITACCTKHMDIRNKYVNEYVKIVFVKSADNDSNILTKNVSTELHEKHSKKMVIEP